MVGEERGKYKYVSPHLSPSENGDFIILSSSFDKPDNTLSTNKDFNQFYEKQVFTFC